jgi:PAS domain S-box-containing protein
MRPGDRGPGGVTPAKVTDFTTLSGLLDLAHDAIVVRTIEGTVLYCNRGAERLYGWSCEEATGQTAHQLLKTKFPVPEDEIRAALIRDGQWEGVLTHVTRSGQSVTVESRWALQRGSGEGAPVLEINRDITARLAAEHSSRTGERKLRFITDSAPIMLAHCDRDGRFRFVNRPYAARFGAEPHELIGRHIQEVIGETAYRTIEPFVLRALAGERVEVEREVHYDALGRHFMRFGYEPEMDDSGQVLGFVAAIQNVSDRRRAEEAERLNRERFEFVVNSTEIGLWYCDVPFDVLVWNAKCKEHFGLPPDAAVTIETFYDRIHPDDRERAREASDAAMARRRPYDVDFRTRQDDGRFKWIRAFGRVLFDGADRPIHFDGATVDITNIKEAEAQLLERDRRKDEFLATLAHELRNPLAPMRFALHLIGSGDQAPDTVARAHAVLERQFRQLVKLVDDLLDVSRITRGRLSIEKRPVPLAEVLTAALEATPFGTNSAQQELSISLPQEPVYVAADPIRLAQVFLNLLNNAAKYTPAGGHVELSARVSDGAVAVSITDDGIGIAPSMLPRIFDMFMQVDLAADQTHGGLGIGLTLVRQLVELHGGRIEAHSDGVGRGSRFVVTLPVAGASAQAAADPSGSVPRSAGKRVLIADDNTDAAEVLEIWLSTRGHEVRTVADGEAALSLAESMRPDVLLLDIGMPKVNGYDVARRIRLQPWGKPMTLVALTGWGQEEDRRRSREAGFDHHLTKPVEPSAVDALVASAGS